MPSVLIVDDEVDIAEILKEQIQGFCNQVILARNGKEALGKVSGQAFDTIISDVSMPVMGGLEFVHKLRENGILTPLIMTTGYADRNTCIEALRYGAFDFLEKPWDENQLIVTLQKSLEIGRKLNRWSCNSEIVKSLENYRENNAYYSALILQKMRNPPKGKVS